MLPGLTLPPYRIRIGVGGAQRSTCPRSAAADDADGLVGVLGGGVAPGADRPDRLVRDDARGGVRGLRTPAKAALRLAVDTFGRCAPASRSSSVSPTHTIGVISCLSTALQLLVHRLVGLAEQLTPLGVADDHVLHVELGQHRRAHLAGERALVLPVAVLRAEPRSGAVGVDQRLQRAAGR